MSVALMLCRGSPKASSLRTPCLLADWLACMLVGLLAYSHISCNECNECNGEFLRCGVACVHVLTPSLPAPACFAQCTTKRCERWEHHPCVNVSYVRV